MTYNHYNDDDHDHKTSQSYLLRQERTISVEMASTIVQTRKTTTGTSQASLMMMIIIRMIMMMMMMMAMVKMLSI